MVQAVLDQAVGARDVYLGLQAAVVAIMLLKWAYLLGQLPPGQWLSRTLVSVALPLLHAIAACGTVIVPVALLVCLLAEGRLEEVSSLTGTVAWLWSRLRAGVCFWCWSCQPGR